MKAILDHEPWRKDPFVVRKPWSEDEYTLKYHGGTQNGPTTLCFAVLEDIGVVRPQPPVRRALKMVVDALREAGHTGECFDGRAIRTYSSDIVIDWKPVLIDDILTLNVRQWTGAWSSLAYPSFSVP